MKRFFVWGGICSAALFLTALVYTLRMDWVPSADFDVTGLLWLLQNLPRLFALVITVLLAALTLFCFIAARRSAGSPLSDEATEARFKERFGV